MCNIESWKVASALVHQKPPRRHCMSTRIDEQTKVTEVHRCKQRHKLYLVQSLDLRKSDERSALSVHINIACGSCHKPLPSKQSTGSSQGLLKLKPDLQPSFIDVSSLVLKSSMWLRGQLSRRYSEASLHFKSHTQAERLSTC
jgi:hypothetical protein